MNSEEYRELTKEEYNNLPLELKICFYLTPWNIHANINSVDDWARAFGDWYYAGYETDAINKIKKEYQLLYEFIKELLDEHISTS
jgi:hypothetical protein